MALRWVAGIGPVLECDGCTEEMEGRGERFGKFELCAECAKRERQAAANHTKTEAA